MKEKSRCNRRTGDDASDAVCQSKRDKKSEMSWPVENCFRKMFYLDGAHCKTTDAADGKSGGKGACGTGDSCGNGVLTVTIPQKRRNG